MITPTEILVHGHDENARSWDQFGQQQRQQEFERGMSGVSSQRAFALEAQKLAGEKDIAGIHNAGALDRVKAQVQGYIDRLDDKQKGKDMAKWKALGITPKPGEQPDDFLARAAVEHGQRVAGQANTIWQEIQKREGQANTMMNGEQRRLAGLAVQRATAQFAPSLDPKLAPLLNSMPVEQVIAKAKPAQQAGLKAQWGQILEGEQQKARSEFSPNVTSQIQMLRYGTDQLQKRHADIIGSNPFASEFLKFDLPEQPKSFEEALAAAGKAQKPTATTTGTGTSGAKIDWRGASQFVPAALQDPDAQAIVEKYHPLGANALNDPNLLDTTRKAIQSKLERDHATLAGMGVHVADDGSNVIVPKSEAVTLPFGETGGLGSAYSPWGMPPKVVARDLSPAERQRRYDAAMQTLSGMHEAANALERLNPPAATPDAGQAADVLSGDYGD